MNINTDGSGWGWVFITITVLNYGEPDLLEVLYQWAVNASEFLYLFPR